MPNKGRIALIVEGEKQEPYYLKRIAAAFPPLKELELICLPAGENIYMLWKRLKADDFSTDLIELIRESASPKTKQQLQGLSRDDFQEIYLFFDFDLQQTNLGLDDGKEPQAVLAEMMQSFDNETENGMLYISYPMSEALRDITPWSCRPYSDCSVLVESGGTYKRRTGKDNPYASVQKYNADTWYMIVAIFLVRCRCLWREEIERAQIYRWYKSTLSVPAIYDRQLEHIAANGAVFVLSAFPEFLLDYFKEEYLLPLIAPALLKVTDTDCPKAGKPEKAEHL